MTRTNGCRNLRNNSENSVLLSAPKTVHDGHQIATLGCLIAIYQLTIDEKLLTSRETSVALAHLEYGTWFQNAIWPFFHRWTHGIIVTKRRQ